jgi:hypothetical protein
MFGWAFLGDVFYSFSLFGAYKLAEKFFLEEQLTP